VTVPRDQRTRLAISAPRPATLRETAPTPLLKEVNVEHSNPAEGRSATSAQKSATSHGTAPRQAGMAEATEATKAAMAVDSVDARTTNLAFRVVELGTTRVIALRVRSVIRAEMLAI